MKKRLLSLALAATMALGMTVPALAATPTFTDVPETYWGYADIEAVAAAGLMNGVGGGEFSPETKVTVAQFLTLVGRLVFPDVRTEGADWYSPYISKAQESGLLTGSLVDVTNAETEITRYDMAVILRAAAKQLGVTEKTAEQGEVIDYGMVPTMYVDAVLAVYGMGLIRGDQLGNFNGSNTMRRSEVATVIMRLEKERSRSTTPGGTITDHGETPLPSTTTEPEKPVESEKPSTVTTEPQYTWLAEAGCAPLKDYDPGAVERVEGTNLLIDRSYRSPEIIGTPYAGYVYFHVGDTFQFTIKEVPGGYGYGEGDLNERVQYWLGQMTERERARHIDDYSNGIWSSDDPSVATVDENGVVTIVGPGQASIQAIIPVIYYRDIWTRKMDSIPIRVDP